jgi:hypothetical protein
MPDGKWKCKCDCGNICYKTPSSLERKDGNQARSCGCKKGANKIAIRSNNTSGVKGVCYNSRTCKWMAYINKDGKRTYLGQYDTKELAVEARHIAEDNMFD